MNEKTNDLGVLTIYSQTPNSKNMTGHVYIGLYDNKTGVESFYHFAPKNVKKALVKPFVESAPFVSHKSSKYDDKVDIVVTRDEMKKIHNSFLDNKHKKYSILAFNCYLFSKKIVQSAGLLFPKVKYLPTPLAASKAMRKAKMVFDDKKATIEQKSEALKRNFSFSKKSQVTEDKEKVARPPIVLSFDTKSNYR